MKHSLVSGSETTNGPKMCSGFYTGGKNSSLPLPGTGCVYACINETGMWGSSWCYTKYDKSEWGAECIHCSGTIRYVI